MLAHLSTVDLELGRRDTRQPPGVVSWWKHTSYETPHLIRCKPKHGMQFCKERETESKRDQGRPGEAASERTKGDQVEGETSKRRRAGGFVA